tara:strand:+ start:2570 stop:3811 length:1242 start_codon:yes stop_codon:yes gene_type:complete
MSDVESSSLFLDPIPGSGLVSVCVGFPGSEETDGPARFGYTGLLLELIRCGGGLLPEEAVVDRFDQWGSGLSAFCTETVSGIRYSCLPDVLRESLELLGRILERVEVSARLLERECSSKIALIQEVRDDPSSDIMARARRCYFRESALGFGPLGSENCLKEVSPDRMNEFGNHFLRKRPRVMAISGDFDSPELGPWVQARFFADEAKMKDRPGISAMPLVEPFQEVVRHAREQSIVLRVFPSGGVSSENSYSRHIALACLNGLAGPLFEEIRERHGLAYFSSARFLAGSQSGLLAFVSGCEESKATFLLDRLDEILMRLGIRGFSEEELETGRAQVRSGVRMNRQKSSWRAMRLAMRAVQGLEIDLGESLLGAVDEVDPSRLTEWCRTAFSKEFGSTIQLLPDRSADTEGPGE